MICSECKQEIGNQVFIDEVQRKNPPKLGRKSTSPPRIWGVYCPLCGVVLQFIPQVI